MFAAVGKRGRKVLGPVRTEVQKKQAEADGGHFNALHVLKYCWGGIMTNE
jgi:hypothetical protein